MATKSQTYSERFEVTGYFYLEGKDKFRKHLDIKIRGSKKDIPDLMVVMMNPGGSEQKIGYKNVTDKIVPTVHDKTQEKIMDFMMSCSSEYARILNLSDCCNKSSSSFYKQIPNLSQNIPSHSVFNEARLAELEHLFINAVPVVLAWGVNPALKELAESALNFLQKSGVDALGLKCNTNTWGYFHPQRRISKYHPNSWLAEMKNNYAAKAIRN
jgi:hypothetical protein